MKSGFLEVPYILTINPQGMIEHYDLVGYIACAATLIAIWLAHQVKPAQD